MNDLLRDGAACGRRIFSPSRWCVLAVGIVGIVLSQGCGRSAPQSKSTSPSTAATSSNEALESAREKLSKQVDLFSCRAALQQLNAHLGRSNVDRPPSLTDEEKARLTQELGLNKDELAEIGSTTFTLLDAHHLDQCFLFRDIARSFDMDFLPPIDQARILFDWVVRQVRQEPRDDAVIPEQYALRRGRGTAYERALIFLGLLDQLSIDGALVSFPQKVQDQIVQRWMPGVLVGSDLYLFDCHLGLALPAGENRVATLRELRAKPDQLQSLQADAKHRYDITPEQVQKAEIYVGCPLSALAPRMRYLETALGSGNRVSLADDVFARQERIRKALGGAVPVHMWKEPGDPQAPTRILRQFLPSDEGGVDTRHSYPVSQLPGFAGPLEAELQMPVTRRDFLRFEMVPWTALPKPIRDLPCLVEIGFKPRMVFSLMFEPFYLLPQQPRDMILRGQLDEAVRALVANRDQIEQTRQAVSSRPSLTQEVMDWTQRAKEVQADFLRSRDRILKEGRTPEGQEALKGQIDAARAPVDAMWKGGEKLLTLLMANAWADAMGGDISYYLALSKQEQAERLQIQLRRPDASRLDAETRALQELWANSASWWETFEQENASAPSLAAARALHARVSLARGNRNKAIALLEDLSGPLTDLEKAGRMYQVRMLRQNASSK